MPGQRPFWEGGGCYRDPEHPVVELFARQRVHHLAASGMLDDVRSLLDVGAGSGFSSAFYPERIRVVACDGALGMLAGNPVSERVLCAADALPFPDRSFDAVTCWELLHHLDQPVEAVREMLRVAGGRVIIFEPNRINPGHVVLALTREEERASIRFSPGHLRRLIEAAGGVIRLHQRCGLLFPNVTPLAVARVLARMPFRVPFIAISQLIVAERRAAG
jgi:SAM-dependent methyltransferase